MLPLRWLEKSYEKQLIFTEMKNLRRMKSKEYIFGWEIGDKNIFVLQIVDMDIQIFVLSDHKTL